MAESDLPTLTYFGLHAKAEPIRMLLAHKGVAFTNRVITFEEWPQIKPTLPAGQMPIWQEAAPGSKMLNQATAILRMLGRKHGYYFSDSEEEAFNVDWVLEAHADFWNTKTYRMWFSGESDQEKVAQGVACFEALNKQLETLLASTNSRFIASDRLTIADFVVFSLYMSLVQNEATQAPELQAALAAKLADTPKVSAYLETMKQEMATYMSQRQAYKF